MHSQESLNREPQILDSVDDCVERLIEQVGSRLVVAAPLGLGKPVQLLNAIYRRVAADSTLNLHIYTALCLERPITEDPIEAALAEPIFERLFGDYEELAFMQALREGCLPDNVQLSEMYFKAGAMKDFPSAQQHYISSNYTHIARDMVAAGVNVLTQMVAQQATEQGASLSLSCNPDLTLEIVALAKQAQQPLFTAAQVHSDLPFMGNDAEVPMSYFDYVVINKNYDKRLFAVPNAAVPLQDYATALHASSLIKDGGTLQIGIGALGDAVAQACILRHHNPDQFQQLLKRLTPEHHSIEQQFEGFKQGLYVSTEMLVNGVLQLFEQGIVKRKVYDDILIQQGLNSGQIQETVNATFFDYGRRCQLIPKQLDEKSLTYLQAFGVLPDSLLLQEGALFLDGQELCNDLDLVQTRDAVIQQQSLKQGIVIHGAFFLGPRDFYQKLRDMDTDRLDSIVMTGVKRTNQLLLNYPLYSAQRRDARFINTGMIAAINGAVASDALEDGTVISGVGGQYNFVAMANDLPGARSILCIRSTRGSGKDITSNIVASYGYTTIPKHLRDIIVTEYGVADLRGQSDSQVIKRMINIADSRFQQQLLQYAKETGKVEAEYSIPESARYNTPEHLAARLQPAIDEGLLPDYPFGTELTAEEEALSASLRHIKALSDEPASFVRSTFRALLHDANDEAARPFLQRLQLEHPHTPREFVVQQLLLLDLEDKGLLKVC